MKPGVLLVEQRDILRVLHDLDWIGRVHGAHQSERQTGAGIVAVGGVVSFPGFQSSFGERKVRRALLVLGALAHVGDIGPLPKSAEIRLAVGSARRRATWGLSALWATGGLSALWATGGLSAQFRSSARCLRKATRRDQRCDSQRECGAGEERENASRHTWYRWLLRGGFLGGSAILGRARKHALAVGQLYRPRIAGVGSVLGPKALDARLVADLQRIPGPAIAGQSIRRSAFT